jgi:hypothetical protein
MFHQERFLLPSYYQVLPGSTVSTSTTRFGGSTTSIEDTNQSLLMQQLNSPMVLVASCYIIIYAGGTLTICESVSKPVNQFISVSTTGTSLVEKL